MPQNSEYDKDKENFLDNNRDYMIDDIECYEIRWRYGRYQIELESDDNMVVLFMAKNKKDCEEFVNSYFDNFYDFISKYEPNEEISSDPPDDIYEAVYDRHQKLIEPKFIERKNHNKELLYSYPEYKIEEVIDEPDPEAEEFVRNLLNNAFGTTTPKNTDNSNVSDQPEEIEMPSFVVKDSENDEMQRATAYEKDTEARSDAGCGCIIIIILSIFFPPLWIVAIPTIIFTMIKMALTPQPKHPCEDDKKVE